MTVDRSESVEAETGKPTGEADATVDTGGTAAAHLTNGEAGEATGDSVATQPQVAADSPDSAPGGTDSTATNGFGASGVPSALDDSAGVEAATAVASAQGDGPASAEPSAGMAASAAATAGPVGSDTDGAHAAAIDSSTSEASTAGEPDTAGTSDVSPDSTGQDAADSRVSADVADAETGPSADDASHAPAASDEDEVLADPAVDNRPEPTTMEELLAEQSTDIRSLKHGDVVEGNVVRIDKDEILVDIGAKSEGVVSNRELYGRNAESQPQLNIGDTVLVYVLQPESNEGHAVLSLRRAGLERKWRSMQEQLDAGVIIEAPVIDHNKGGLIVDCGIRGFVPISQIVDFPRRPQNEQPRDAAQEIAEKLQPYVGRKLRLKILEVNRKANRLILSEKVALYEERREKRDELFSSLKVSQQVKGTVRSIAPFGVFVDLGGIDGLVHKSELSWNKVNNPEAGYRVGEEVEAEVIDINHERGRISLSIRRLQPDPWHSTVADLKVGDVIEGTVTKIVNFGAFVRVREGLEGLIHISELSQQRVAHPGDVVHEGQKLNLKVISLDSERHRLGLSLKQAEETAAPRPAAEPPAQRERSDRRGSGRSERSGYDASQAVQEPEGGIDNTLAAAFAQVRQQMADQESAATPGQTPAETVEASPSTLKSASETSTEDANTSTVAAEAVAAEDPGAVDQVASAEEMSAADEASFTGPSSDEASPAEPSSDDEAPAPSSDAGTADEAPAPSSDAGTADEAPAPSSDAGTAEASVDRAGTEDVNASPVAPEAVAAEDPGVVDRVPSVEEIGAADQALPAEPSSDDATRTDRNVEEPAGG